MNSKSVYVMPFDQLRMADVSQVGGKNASLGEMIGRLAGAGIRVPAGFATTTEAFHEFLAQNEVRGRRVEFLQGDINDPSTTAAIGTVDCVFCAGVLYHVPNPLATLAQLRRICRKTTTSHG